MVRTVIITNKKTISFQVPEDYIGKQIEVIAFAKEESLLTEQPPQKKVSFTVLHTDVNGYTFNRDEANER